MAKELLDFFFQHSLIIFSFITIMAITIRVIAWSSSRKDYLYFQNVAKNIDSELGKTPGVYHKDSLDKSLVIVFKNISSHLPNRFFHKQKTIKTRPYMNTEFIDHDEFIVEHSFFQGLIKEIDSFKSFYPHSWTAMSKKILQDDQYWSRAYGLLPISSIIKLTNFLPQGIIFLGIICSLIGITQSMPDLALNSLSNLEWSDFFKSFMAQLNHSLAPIIYGTIFSFLLSSTNSLFTSHNYRLDTVNVVANTLENIWLKVNGEQTIEGKFQRYLPLIVEQIKLLKRINNQLNGQHAPHHHAS